MITFEFLSSRREERREKKTLFCLKRQIHTEVTRDVFTRLVEERMTMAMFTKSATVYAAFAPFLFDRFIGLFLCRLMVGLYERVVIISHFINKKTEKNLYRNLYLEI